MCRGPLKCLNNAAMDFYMFLCEETFSVLVDLSLRVEVLEPIAAQLNFVKDFQTVSHAHDAPTSVEGFRLPHILANTIFGFLFLILVSLVTVK